MTLHTEALSNVKSSISRLLCPLRYPAALHLITSLQCNLLPAPPGFQVPHNRCRRQALLSASDGALDRAVRWKGPVYWCGQALHIRLFFTSQGCCWRLSPCSRETKQDSLQIWRKAHFQSSGHTAHNELKSWERNKAEVLQGLTPIFKQIFIHF